jgi:large subunit ribosomal protein L25
VATKRELKLTVATREQLGTTGARRARRAGKIPAVVYGHGAAPEHVVLEARAFEDVLGHGGRSAIVTLDGGKQSETALIRDVQYDPVSRRVVHADFQRVSADETIHTRLPVVTVGVAAGVRTFGGVMDVLMHELEVEGPASRIPEHVEIDVAHLGIHDHITAADVKLPSGFKMLTPGETIVVSIEPSRTEREVEEAAVPAEIVEPELVGQAPESQAAE